MSKTPSVRADIVRLRERFFALKAGKESLLRLIDEAEVSEQVYNSNAIENSTLSLEETEKILQQIELDRIISQRELFEAKNLARVVEYINQRSSTTEFNTELLLLLHRMLLSNIRDEVAGRFRAADEWVRVANHIAPDPTLVPQQLQEMIHRYQANPMVHIVERVALVHLMFEHIHPFVDGNGRIGRVLVNYLLIREGYVGINIKYSNRARYYEALRDYDREKKTKGMEELIGRALANSFHKRLAYLNGRQIVSLKHYAEQKRLSYTNLLNKAERQTIPAFTERGIWKIGADD